MDEVAIDEPAGATGTLFVVEPSEGALAALAVAAGWRVFADHDGSATVQHYVESGATIVVIDARRDPARGSAIAATLAEPVEERGGAMLAILGDGAAAEAFYDAGATQFLVAPDDATILQGLRFAARAAARQERRGPQRTGGDATEAARDWIARRIADDRPVAAALATLSRFDIVNAAYGRMAGNALIEAAGLRLGTLAHALFDGDALVARVGGSEFALLAEAGGERIAHAAARMGEALARPFALGDALATVGSRIGVAELEPGDDAAALLYRAREALATAKASDGATMRVAAPGGIAPLDALATDLHRAIDREEIDVVFQPQIDLASGRVRGVEALARWDHPTLGPLGAEPLFAAAGRADLGVALSGHIHRVALARAAAWPAALAALRLSLNVTAADVTRPGFAASFLALAEASGFPLDRLTIEVTESGLIDDLTAAAALLETLRVAGCRVAIDDFGTGYSSLAYLRALPLDYLKIDKAMTGDIVGTPRDRVVVRGVIDMAHALGLAVIAEGVETQAQRDLLAAEGCDQYQGFLCAGPLGDAALADLVEANPRC